MCTYFFVCVNVSLWKTNKTKSLSPFIPIKGIALRRKVRIYLYCCTVRIIVFDLSTFPISLRLIHCFLVLLKTTIFNTFGYSTNRNKCSNVDNDRVNCKISKENSKSFHFTIPPNTNSLLKWTHKVSLKN